MEFKQLESYAAVVRHLSFTKAAESLYTSQPTVSTHVRDLEKELNLQLLRRTTKSLHVTPDGQKVYEYAVNLLEMRDRMLRECTPGSQKIIHLGASAIPAAYILPELLPSFSAAAPNRFFVLHQSDSRETAEGVVSGIYDVGLIGRNIQQENLVCESFCQDRMVIITPITEFYLQLASLPETPLEKLMQQPLILREKGGGKKHADQFLEQLGIPEENLTITARVNDPEAIKNLVAGGLGISIISQRAAQNFLNEKRLLKFDLPAWSHSRELYIIHRRDLGEQAHIREFIDFVRKFYK